MRSAFNNRVHCALLNGDLEGALEDMDEAIRLKPDDAENFNNRGNVRREKGDLEGALQDFNEAIRLKPDFALALKNRDDCAQSHSRPGKVLTSWSLAAPSGSPQVTQRLKVTNVPLLS